MIHTSRILDTQSADVKDCADHLTHSPPLNSYLVEKKFKRGTWSSKISQELGEATEIDIIIKLEVSTSN